MWRRFISMKNANTDEHKCHKIYCGASIQGHTGCGGDGRYRHCHMEGLGIAAWPINLIPLRCHCHPGVMD